LRVSEFDLRQVCLKFLKDLQTAMPVGDQRVQLTLQLIFVDTWDHKFVSVSHLRVGLHQTTREAQSVALDNG
jgi:hypothetical protein